MGEYSWRCTYLHDRQYPSQAIDVHHVILTNRDSKGFLSIALKLLLLLPLAIAFHLFLFKEKSVSPIFWSFLLGALLLKSLLFTSVEKESVVIMPAFGVQLETHYRRPYMFLFFNSYRGRITRRFVPIGKILKPVLNECVTPVTCYWSLSLLVRDEDELMLVFKELRPPAKILVPIWKALCAAANNEDSLNM